MRKVTMSGAVAVLALVLAGCSGVTGDSESDASRPSSTAPPTAAASTAPTPARSPSLSGAALRLAGTRDKLQTAQTYKGHSEAQTDGVLTSTHDFQVRLGDRAALRQVTTVFPAAYEGLGLPNRPTEPQVSESLQLPGGVVYSSNSPLMIQLSNGKHWSKTTLDLPTSTSSTPEDFSAQLALLQKAGDIGEVGKETIDGIATTHYNGTISLLLLHDNAAADFGLSEKQYEALRAFWTDQGFDNARIDLWIGQDSLPVRQITVTTAKSGGVPKTTKVTTRYWDWGKPIDDTPPPADDVDEISPGGLPGALPTRNPS
ncbi:MAG TPA: hypothetical protein VLH10_14125 [Yinghuangia sp.]|nr:hypothetical protein [Yinghuangia sp.]